MRLNLLVMGAGLLLSAPVLAQFGSVGGHVGPNTSGGVDEKDELKSFHQAMALQATNQQTAEFRSVVKSSEAASRDLEGLGKDSGKQGDAAALSSRTTTLRQALDQARLETGKFLDGFSPAQKSGLKDITARLLKAEADLGEREKMLDAGFINANPVDTMSVREELGKALANLRKEQDSLAVEMGIVQSAGGLDVAFKIPPFKSSLTIANQPVAVTSSTMIFRVGPESEQNVFKVEATTNLSDLQQNMTEILGALLNKGDRCGERIEVEDGTLTPSDPSSLVVAQLRYQRWVCHRMGRDENSSEVAEGNATVEVKLTPAIGPQGELQVVPEIGRVEADRFLSDLVRSGDLGVALREKIARAVGAAITDLKAALPPAARDSAKIENVRFETLPDGGLNAIVSGEMRISEEQTKLMGSQIKEQLASRAVAPR
ncbi:MAG: hypothetical protein WA172_00580 [Terriglobales bacterium]